MERLKALLRRFGETSADCIVHTQGFNLSSVSLLIDDYRRIDISSKFSPIFNLVVNQFVVRVDITPVTSSKALFDAGLSCTEA